MKLLYFGPFSEPEDRNLGWSFVPSIQYPWNRNSADFRQNWRSCLWLGGKSCRMREKNSTLSLRNGKPESTRKCDRFKTLSHPSSPGFSRPQRFTAKRGQLKPKAQTDPHQMNSKNWKMSHFLSSVLVLKLSLKISSWDQRKNISTKDRGWASNFD